MNAKNAFRQLPSDMVPNEGCIYVESTPYVCKRGMIKYLALIVAIEKVGYQNNVRVHSNRIA